MPTYDVGISDVQHEPPVRVDITIEASGPREAMAVAEAVWHEENGYEPPSALRGINWGR